MNSAWPSGARRWGLQELQRDADASRADFRARRLSEPLARYLEAFDAAGPAFVTLIDQLDMVLAGGPQAAPVLRDLWASELGRTAFRYLGAPPISEDDLKTLADARLNPSAVGNAAAQRVLEVLRVIVDPRRFPWLAAGRPSTRQERAAAQLASTVLVASQRVQTLRRGDEKSAVEALEQGSCAERAGLDRPIWLAGRGSRGAARRVQRALCRRSAGHTDGHLLEPPAGRPEGLRGGRDMNLPWC